MKLKLTVLFLMLMFLCLGITGLSSPFGCIGDLMGCGGSWVELGESASGNGLSNTDYDSGLPFGHEKQCPAENISCKRLPCNGYAPFRTPVSHSGK